MRRGRAGRRPDREVRLPGHHVHHGAGEQEVELATRDLAVGVRGLVRRRRRPELAREPAARLEPVGVRRDVEHLREARVRDRAVVALEEVLDADLPVAGVLVRLGPRVEAERGHVDAVGGEEVGQLAELVGERRRLGIRVDEDERPPRVDRHRDEAEAGLVEPGLAIRARARFAAHRRGRRSTRGTGTGSSRGARRRRRGGAHGGGRR